MASFDIVVRQAQVAEVASIATCLGALGFEIPADLIEQRLSRTTTFVASASVNGPIVGVAAVHVIPMLHWTRDIARVTVVAVDRSIQRHGIGRSLLATIESYAWASGCERVEVICGDSRLGAHAFYDAVGYTVTAKRFVKLATAI